MKLLLFIKPTPAILKTIAAVELQVGVINIDEVAFATALVAVVAVVVFATVVGFSCGCCCLSLLPLDLNGT